MKIRWPLWLLLLPFASVCAQEQLDLADLGDLEIAWAPVESLEQVPGPPLRARVEAEPGAAFRLLLPATVQRATFHAAPGAAVEVGSPVVLLEGPEIHHWGLAIEALKVRYGTALRRYERNLPLYRDGALSEDRWAEIQERYFALRLDYEHMRHFQEWLLPAPDDSQEALLLGAPVAGLLVYDSARVALDEGQTLFEILPADGLRLRIEVPADRSAALAGLEFGDCQALIDRVEHAARGYYRTAWSQPLAEPCLPAPGAALSVRPLYRESALRVPRDAVFQWRREPHVWLRRGDRLLVQPVVLLADDENGFAVAADDALDGGEVLVRSVSAAQGILLGLGGE